MNKKGQVFLIAAIIFIFAVYSVIIKYNTAKEYATLEDYEEITENYQSEFPKVVNKALYKEDETVESALEKFNKKFLSNARQKDPNYGVLYAYKDARGNLHIVNTLNKKVININFETVRGERLTAESININLPDATLTSRGCVSVGNLGCTSTDAKLVSFGEKYSNTYDYTGNLEKMVITILDEDTSFELDIKEFDTMNYISSSSEERISTTDGSTLPREIKATLTTT